MIVAIHMVQVFEIILGTMWFLVALMLIWGMIQAKTDFLKPVRIFGLVLSGLWIFVYFVAASESLSQFAVGTPMALHSIGNGLLFVTILFVLLVLYTSRHFLKNIGAEG